MRKADSVSYVLNNLEVHKRLQESILRDIGRRLVKNPELVTDTAAWQAEKLQQSGMLFNDITKELSKATKRQQKEIKAAFDEAETKIFDYDDEEITAAGFDPAEFKKLSPSMRQTWNATLAKTSTEAINLTKTTAMTSQSAYIEACDLALMQVQSGAFDYNTAIKNACMSAGTKGVNVIYPSGWVDKLDVAVRRSVMTGVSQTAGKIQEMRADELDIDIMEITAHSGARPEHAKWQGKLVSRSGKEGYLSLSDIGYGTVTGFKGANCSHNWFLFFEGVSKRKYTDEELEALKNETVTYNGEEIPKWQAIEKQRAIERAVKESKRQLVVLDEGLKNAKTDDLKAELQTAFNNTSVRLKKQEARLKDFCKQTGLYYDNSRVQVFTQATENGVKNWGKSVSGKAVWANKKAVDNSVKSGIIKENEKTSELGRFKEKIRNDPNMSKEYYFAVKKKFSHGSDFAKETFNKFVPENSVADSAFEGTAKYNIKTKRISMHYGADINNPRGTCVTYFHEHGHLIDDVAGNLSKDKEFRRLLEEDALLYRKAYGKSHGLKTFDEVDKAISKELNSMRKHSGVSDIFDGITRGNISGIAGHDIDYWEKEGNVEAEAFAHMFASQFDKVRYMETKKYFPKSLDWFESKLKEAIR